MKLDKKVIVVTGANRGIGAGIVRELLKHNVSKVYAAARSVKSLPDFGDSRVVPLVLDITDEKQVVAAAKAAKDAQVLINNAGTLQHGSLLDSTLDNIRTDMETNYFGTLSIVRVFAPVLRKNGVGLIASVSSVVGLAAIPSIGGYSVSKFAVHGLIQSLRAELADTGISVAGIYPGPIDTDMAKDIPMEKTSVADTAQAIVAGLIKGDDYIFPDAMSKNVGALWMNDPVALEKQFAARPASAEEAA